MDRKEEILFKLDCGKKTYFRGGNILKNVITKSKDVVSGEDALLVFNTYGIDLRLLNLFFMSHGLEIDQEGFFGLLIEQEEKTKKCKLCNKEE